MSAVIVPYINTTDNVCSICFDNIPSTMIKTHCNHLFCSECITKAIDYNGKLCPICRNEFRLCDNFKECNLCSIIISIGVKNNKLQQCLMLMLFILILILILILIFIAYKIYNMRI